MNNHTIYDQARTYIIGALHRSIKLSDFAVWVYGSTNLSAIIGFIEDEKLLSIDYNDVKAYEALDPILLQVYEHLDQEGYHREHIRRILCSLLNDSTNLVSACASLAYYYNLGYNWLPILFVGLDSELDAIPRLGANNGNIVNTNDLDAIYPWLSTYRQQAKDVALQTLQQYYSDVLCPK